MFDVRMLRIVKVIVKSDRYNLKVARVSERF